MFAPKRNAGFTHHTSPQLTQINVRADLCLYR